MTLGEGSLYFSSDFSKSSEKREISYANPKEIEKKEYNYKSVKSGKLFLGTGFAELSGNFGESKASAVSINKSNVPRIRIGKEPPTFNRSTHVKTALKRLEVNLPKKERAGERPDTSIILSIMPQIAMIAVMIVVAIIGSPGTLVFTLPMYLITIIVTILRDRSQKKKYDKKLDYIESKYISDKSRATKLINDNKDSQTQVLNSEYPSVDACFETVQKKSSWMWRVSIVEDMFLDTRLGMGDVPTVVDIKDSYDPQLVDKEFIENATILKNVPVSCPIREYSVVGLVGPRKQILNQARLILTYSAVNLSYDELKIVIFAPQSEKFEWEWTRWLPHIWSEDWQNRYLAISKESNIKLCKEVEQIISERTSPVAGDCVYKTHYLILVADKSIVAQQGLLSMLTGHTSSLGISTVIMESDISNLPSGCNSIIELSSGECSWYPANDIEDKHFFYPDIIDVGRCNKIARMLAPVRLGESSDGGKLPNSVTFMDAYGVKRIDDFDIESRWNKSDYGNSLAVPIGIKSNGEKLLFDINEHADGPHGMVSGAAGSGKSDLVQSWILSMALHFRPTEVSFIIVDYKGDGLLAPFRNLPHLVGTISNLDNKVERNVTALNSEINRRQELFKQCGAHNIEDYIEQYKHGKMKKPLPYLIVIIDEFADFKANHPEFMPIVNAIYTKGRSLGIYAMVLAQDVAAAAAGTTIEVNSNFRWSMKVNSDDASMGILGTHDAYTMTKHPGRGYAKVGNFETYEKIQAFWSGAYYNPDKNNNLKDIPPVSIVAADGTRSPINPDKSDRDKEMGVWTSVKEIDAIVEYIASYTAKTNTTIPDQVWQPPMPSHICIDDYIANDIKSGIWNDKTSLIETTLGLADDPIGQKQFTLSYKLKDSGHISVQGGPESGKTNAIFTAVLSMARRYSPEYLNIYLFDYDKWKLNLLRNLPHVKGSTAAAEADEISEVIHSVRDELNRRRVLFLKKGVTTLEDYCALGENLPAVVLFIDNISAAWEESIEIQELIYDIAQKGAGYGIYMFATAPGTMFPYKLMGFFKTKVSLKQEDKGDYTSIVGKSEFLPEDYPGRGLARMAYPVEIQIALPIQGEGEAERNKNIHELVEKMNGLWNERKTEFEVEKINWHNMSGRGGLILGTDNKTQESVIFADSGKHTLMISSDKQDYLIRINQSITEQIAEMEDTELIIFDDKAESLNETVYTSYFSSGDSSADVFLESMMDILNNRAVGKGKNEKGEFTKIYMLIADWKDFFDYIDNKTVDYVRDIVEMGQGLSVYMIFSGLNSGISFLANSGEKLTNRILKQKHLILLGGSIISHKLVQTHLSLDEEKMNIPKGMGCYINGNMVERINLL